ncbi:MAG: hypothetical protein EXR11_06690 [Rhodospirillaceae bacterium]|nr:hypothetical protein [Rhodospirillaceae bacterium]
MSEPQSPAVPLWRSGKAVVFVITAVLVFGSYFYEKTVPPAWLRAFAADMALRAAADPNPPLPEDTRQASPRGLADNSLICMVNAMSWPWDRVVFVTHAQGKSLSTHPVLATAKWTNSTLADTQTLLSADDRYQLIVLLQGNAVLDSQIFYTFWADLSALAQPEGFGRENAIFTAESRGGRYVMATAMNATLDTCPKPGAAP